MFHPQLDSNLKTKHEVLRKYNLSSDALIQRGMEAEVYALSEDTVLKLYPGTASLADLVILQNFYAAIDPSVLSYQLPYIQTVAAEGDFCISIERHLPGTPLSAVLPRLTKDPIGRMMRIYLDAALELSNIHILPGFDRYKLFDPEGISQRANGDWHQFLWRFLAFKLAQVMPYLSRDVRDLSAKVQTMNAILAQPYHGGYHLIHGDFFPGNLLIDPDHRVTALLDFGLFTMFGDPLFDLATSWVFFDMYDQLKRNLRERYLPMLLERLGQGARGKLYRYVLLYSFLSGNTYSPQCADGQYQWCVANLNCQEYWEKLD
jgi:hypothetical protein